MVESLGVSESVTVEVVRANPLSALPSVGLPSATGLELSSSMIIAIVGILVGVTFAYLGMRKYRNNTAQYAGYNTGLWGGGRKKYQKHFDKNMKMSLKRESKISSKSGSKKSSRSSKVALSAPSLPKRSMTLPDMSKGEIAAPMPPGSASTGGFPGKNLLISAAISFGVGLVTLLISGSELSWLLAVAVFYYRYFVKK